MHPGKRERLYNEIHHHLSARPQMEITRHCPTILTGGSQRTQTTDTFHTLWTTLLDNASSPRSELPLGRQRGHDAHMRLRLLLQSKQTATIHRYVTPGRGSVRRYMKLLGGFLYLPDREAVHFGRALARDARRITDQELEFLLSVEWRARLTAAWLIGLDRRTQFREHLGRLLLESDLVHAGSGYCFALARFAEPQDTEILTAYLDHYLPRLDCHYDQDHALGALLHLDARNNTHHAARYLIPNGLWSQSTWRDTDPAKCKSNMDERCAFATAAMSKTLPGWAAGRRKT